MHAAAFALSGMKNKVPERDEASPSVVSRNLDDAKKLGVRIVDFTGGEPLLYKGLPEALAYAKKIGLKTTVTTNGIIYPDRSSELNGLIDILQFSLDGSCREIHDDIKGVSSFDRVFESIEVARGLGERPTCIHTVTDENLARVPEVISLARSIKVPLFINPCFSYGGNGGLSPESAAELRKIVRGGGVSLDHGFLKFLMDGGNKRSSSLCLAMSSTIVISPDDKLLLPCFHFQTKALPIDGRLLALRSSPEFLEEQKHEGRYGFCEGCAINCYIRASLFRSLKPVFSSQYFFRQENICLNIIV